MSVGDGSIGSFLIVRRGTARNVKISAGVAKPLLLTRIYCHIQRGRE